MSSGLCISCHEKSDPPGTVPWIRRSGRSAEASGRRLLMTEECHYRQSPLTSRDSGFSSALQTRHWAASLHSGLHFTTVSVFFLRLAAQDSPGCLGAHYVASRVLKLRAILLPQSPEYKLSVSGELPLNGIISYEIFGCLLPQFYINDLFVFTDVQGNTLCRETGLQRGTARSCLL